MCPTERIDDDDDGRAVELERSISWPGLRRGSMRGPGEFVWGLSGDFCVMDLMGVDESVGLLADGFRKDS